MPRRVRVRATRPGSEGTLQPWLWEYLTLGTAPEEGEPGREEYLHARFMGGGPALWATWRAEVLSRWIAEKPGTRPRAWYEYDCPAGEERCKVGGSGEQTAVANLDRRPEYFDCDAGDPPKIESEPAFLKRLGVLEAGEERRVSRRAWAAVRLKIDAEGLGGVDRGRAYGTGCGPAGRIPPRLRTSPSSLVTVQSHQRPSFSLSAA